MAKKNEEWTQEQLSAEDEQLLEAFFLPARQQQIADDGFSSRVMQQIPEAAVSVTTLTDSRVIRQSRLWTVFCVVAAVGVFTWIGGWSRMLTTVVGFLAQMPTLGQLLQLMCLGALFMALLVTELLRREKISLRELKL